MKARLKPVKAYELLGTDGRVIARLVKTSSWEGMAKLQTDDGKTLIVEQPRGMEQAMAEAMGAMGAGDGTVECDIFRASPSLIASLLEQPGAHAKPSTSQGTKAEPIAALVAESERLGLYGDKVEQKGGD